MDPFKSSIAPSEILHWINAFPPHCACLLYDSLDYFLPDSSISPCVFGLFLVGPIKFLIQFLIKAKQ